LSRVFEIADRFVEKFAAADPVAATFMGVAGHDGRLTDYSPEGTAELNGLSAGTLREIGHAEPGDERERICRDTVVDELGLSVELFKAKEYLRNLNTMHCPVQGLRMVFDLMPKSTEEDWRNIALRLNGIPWALNRYRTSLDEGLRLGVVAAKRQTEGTAKQAEVWSGAKGGRSFFATLIEGYDRAGLKNPALKADLEEGASASAAAYADIVSYLRETYLPNAAGKDGVGRERYALWARSYNGAEIDLDETYAWGWEQLRWVRSEMVKTARTIIKDSAGLSDAAVIDQAIRVLESDTARSIEGVEEFRKWMQDLQDRTIAELNGKHFDIPDPVKKIEALIAPPGGALAMYYTGPSEDFSRPGRTWYPTGGKTRFPVWREVSIAYHEGVPGHHFQIATQKHMSGELSRYQRLFAGTSGYAEGWALYAERLMAELGYLENPDYYLGMLDAQALRSVRVIIDIGMHLGLNVPPSSAFHPGETWSPELGFEMMKDYVHFPEDFVRSEIDRYLGIPGQAISYKVGEREWLAARASSRQKAGPNFNLKEWHNRALRLGPMGLAQMKREMAKF
jgi:uncharacterized protein (DUF885 family)